MRTIHKIARQMLPANIKRRIVSWGHKLDPVASMHLAHTEHMAPNMELGLEKLVARGLRPKAILDLGAFHGDWSKMARHLWPDADITMFEANEEKRETLTAVASELGAKLHMALLGPKDDEDVVFYVMESGSSVYSENSPLERREERRTSQRLDSLIETEQAYFVKIDVQGFELEVLKGATKVLSNAQAVLLEVSLLEINEGAPLLADVVEFMKQHGLVVCDILELHRRPLDQATNQVDLLFVPKTSPLMTDTRHF